MHRAFSVPVLIAFNALAFAQNAQQLVHPSHASSPPLHSIPTVKLTFDAGTPVPGAPKSLALAIPILCNSDGSAVIQGFDPTNPNNPPAIFRIAADKQVTLYHPDQLEGLSAVQVIDIYPDERELITLIEAKPLIFGKPDTDTTKPPASYIAVFDVHGMKEEVLPLELPFVPLKIARFPSGAYLAEGRQNNDFALALLNSDGSLNRYLDIYNDLPVTEKSVRHTYGGGPQSISRATLFMYFFPAGKDILLVPKGTSLPIVEFNEGGFVRSLKVDLPKDQQLDYFISAAPSVWTMRFSHSSNGGLTSDGISIYDVSAEDGKLLREYSSPLHPGLIACHDGKAFTTFKADETTNQLLLLNSN